MTDDTEAQLRAIFTHLDPVPPLLDEAARNAFEWRTVDEELAELMRDSADEEAGALVRGPGGPRQLSFESPEIEIELEVVATGPRERRLEGQLLPPGDGDRHDRAPGRGRALRAGRRPRALRARRPARRGRPAARALERVADRDPVDDDLEQFVDAYREREVRLRRGRVGGQQVVLGVLGRREAVARHRAGEHRGRDR